MKAIHVFSRRTKYILSAATLVLTFIAPTLFTGFASAAQLTERSVDLSSSAASATGVTYKVSFTGTATAGAFVIELCSDSPVVGNSCAAPDGSSIHNATIGSEDSGTDTVTLNKLTADEANAIEVTDASIAAAHTTTVDLDGVVNPTNAGTIYARIVTFGTEAQAKAYASETLAGKVDSGSVALAITSDLNVSGEVQESLEFCESGAAYTSTPNDAAGASCGGATAVGPIHLGTQTGTGDYVLGTSTPSTSTIYTQISTNAVHGAIVSLKSSATGCGGLVNSSDPSACYIKPATAVTGVVGDSATFGLKLGSAVNNSAAASGYGTVAAYNGSGYNASTYLLNYDASGDNATGVTSPYGDKVLSTGGAPADSQSIPITFGAAASNLTPAGNYSADLSLIATGSF